MDFLLQVAPIAHWNKLDIGRRLNILHLLYSPKTCCHYNCLSFTLFSVSHASFVEGTTSDWESQFQCKAHKVILSSPECVAHLSHFKASYYKVESMTSHNKSYLVSFWEIMQFLQHPSTNDNQAFLGYQTFKNWTATFLNMREKGCYFLLFIFLELNCFISK